MSKVSLTRKRKAFKQFRAVPALPDPLRTFEEFEKSRNLDIQELDDLQLYREELRAEKLLATCNFESIYFLGDGGNPVTVGDWLLRRLAAIRGEREGRTCY